MTVGLCVSMPAENDAVRLALEAFRHRLTQVLRHELALAYDVDVAMAHQHGPTTEFLIVVTVRDGAEERISDVVWSQFVTFTSAGPRPADVAYVLEGMAYETSVPETAEAEAARQAWRHVRGIDYLPLEDLLTAYRAVTPDDVMAAMGGLFASATLFVPEDVEFKGVGIEPSTWCEAGEPMTGTEYRPNWLNRALSADARSTRLLVSDDGIGWFDPHDRHAIRWDQMLEIRTDPDDPAVRFVVGVNGCIISLDAGFFGQTALDDFELRLSRAVTQGLPPVPRS